MTTRRVRSKGENVQQHITFLTCALGPYALKSQHPSPASISHICRRKTREKKTISDAPKLKSRDCEGTRGQNWYSDKRVGFIRCKVRTQNAWLLHLAGDFHASFETKQLLHRPHLMRCMLTSNLAVDQRFANGTQGRLLHFSPADVEGSKQAVPASHPEMMARLVKESSVQKRGQLLPDIDMMDILVRQEHLNIRGEPIMLQLPLAPAYAPSSRQQLCSASIGLSNSGGI